MEVVGGWLAFHWAVDAKIPTESNDLQSPTNFFTTKADSLIRESPLAPVGAFGTLLSRFTKEKSWVLDLTGEHGKGVKFLH